ncbi:hypothetical protein [Terrisporobacter glycolicus]|uniref:hypothetical protein n=1 Tax=Terrisporobacter glycolicus TaxID=36841 RepID=UPI000CDED250
MKKYFTLALCFILVSTNISFANTNNTTVSTNISSAKTNNITDAIRDIEMVNSSTKIIIRKIVGDEPLEAETLRKDIAFSQSILEQQSKKASTLYSRESDFELRETYASILFTIILYELTLSNILTYINDHSKVDYFIHACKSYLDAENSLKNLKIKYL